ncbi:hypothetical protein ABPG77_009051 [Micractinium sp. CCAP 211/92]
MSQASQRAATQLCRAASSLLQWRGMAKAVTTKLNVELLETVEGVGTAGRMARVNHGFARNFLVPNKLAVVVPQLRRRRGSTGADEAAAEQQRQQQVAAAASPGQQTLEKQQQQFDKLLKTLTGSTLTLKRRTMDGQALEQALTAQDISDAVAKQLRIRLVPEMVDLGGETLKVAGEYRLPLKLVLPSGERAQLDVTVSST